MKERCKFDELRSKTDRDLIHLLEKELDSGLVAAFEGRDGRAHDAYNRLSRLMRVIPPDEAERVWLQIRMARLRRVLHRRERAATPEHDPAMCVPCC